MKKLFLLIPMLLLISSVSAETIVLLDINFNGTGSTSLQPDSLGRYWNGTAGVLPTNIGNICSNARDSETFTPLGINFALSDAFKGQNTQGPTSSSLVDWDMGVTDDNWWVSQLEGDPRAEMTISNLDPNMTYDFLFYGARGSTGNRPMRVTIDGVSKYYQSANEGMVTFSGISPNGSNQIVIEFYNTDDDPGTTDYYAYLSGIQMTIIPEPATMCIVTAGLMFGVIRENR